MARSNPEIIEYISSAPETGRKHLKDIRKLARVLCPKAEEVISYKMPALREGKVFFFFAAFKQHIGIYPPVKADADLMQRLAPYRGPKGNLIFKYDDGIPLALLGEVIMALHAAQAVRK